MATLIARLDRIIHPSRVARKRADAEHLARCMARYHYGA